MGLGGLQIVQIRVPRIVSMCYDELCACLLSAESHQAAVGLVVQISAAVGVLYYTTIGLLKLKACREWSSRLASTALCCSSQGLWSYAA